MEKGGEIFYKSGLGNFVAPKVSATAGVRDLEKKVHPISIHFKLRGGSVVDKHLKKKHQFFF